ncbi:hypothetical protein HYT52_00510 [Candidatus Woesearchaeota archaeon]|nr:hypothetical protein [Candidatus Woesearchaeota archaeon]
MDLSKKREMNRSLLPLTVLLVLTLFLSSCGSSVQPEPIQYFKEGVKDVKLSFFQNTPPKEIYEDSDFKIAVELDNQLGYDIKEVSVAMAGDLDSRYLQLTDEEMEKRPEGSMGDGYLLGRSPTNPVGERSILEFSAHSGRLFENSERQELGFFAKASYASEVLFLDTICINPNLYDVYDSGCKVDPQKSYTGQGAPLAVTKMEQVVSPGSGAEVELRLTVKNKGKGRVKSIYVRSAKLGSSEVYCKFKGPDSRTWNVNTFDEALLICNTVLDQISSYETTFSVEMDYEYVLSSFKSISLVK